MSELSKRERIRRRKIRWELRKLGVLTAKNASGKGDLCNICGKTIKTIAHFKSHPDVWFKALSRIDRDLLLPSEVAIVEEIEEVIAR